MPKENEVDQVILEKAKNRNRIKLENEFDKIKHKYWHSIIMAIIFIASLYFYLYLDQLEGSVTYLNKFLAMLTLYTIVTVENILTNRRINLISKLLKK